MEGRVKRGSVRRREEFDGFIWRMEEKRLAHISRCRSGFIR